MKNVFSFVGVFASAIMFTGSSYGVPQICGWKWEGIKSRWECHDNPSALSYLKVEETVNLRITNPSDFYSATFGLRCNKEEGETKWTMILPLEDKTYLCPKNVDGYVEYVSSLLTGGQQKAKKSRVQANHCYIFKVYRNEQGRHQELKETRCNKSSPFAAFLADSLPPTGWHAFYHTKGRFVKIDGEKWEEWNSEEKLVDTFTIHSTDNNFVYLSSVSRQGLMLAIDAHKVYWRQNDGPFNLIYHGDSQ